jgi:transcription antitermination factor NusG
MYLDASNLKLEKDSADARWYAVYTKHQHEKKAADLLTRKGVEVYLPFHHSVRQWQDRKKTLALPLFPGYVFLRSTLENKAEILSTPGLFFIVESAGHACSIPDHEIESLRTITSSQALIEAHPFLHSGDYVWIQRGPLAGVRGILTRVKNQNRVVLCVELLRKAVSVEIDVADVEKIGNSYAQTVS